MMGFSFSLEFDLLFSLDTPEVAKNSETCSSIATRCAEVPLSWYVGWIQALQKGHRKRQFGWRLRMSSDVEGVLMQEKQQRPRQRQVGRAGGMAVDNEACEVL